MPRLGRWNLAVSGALYEALGILEVVLRNALGTQLAAHHGTLAGHWYDDPLGMLSDLAHQDIAAPVTACENYGVPRHPAGWSRS